MLFMPTFAVELLAGFTMRTWLSKMAIYHSEGDKKNFKRLIMKQLAVVGVVTLAGMIFMYFFGGWFLSTIYGVDLYGYEIVNALLMFSGGLVAAYTLFENVVIIYRRQHFSIIINVLATIAAAVIVPILTNRGFILGASIGYVIANLVRTLGYVILSVNCIIKDRR